MTNILDDSYESDLTDEESEQLLLMSEHAITKPISPVAQAVLDAFRTSHTGPGCLAAAIRAAAEHSVPDDSEGYYVFLPNLLAIADELESPQPDQQ